MSFSLQLIQRRWPGDRVQQEAPIGRSIRTEVRKLGWHRPPPRFDEGRRSGTFDHAEEAWSLRKASNSERFGVQAVGDGRARSERHQDP